MRGVVDSARTLDSPAWFSALSSMSAITDKHSATHTCCVHSENAAEMTGPHLLNVTLLAEDMKEFVIDLSKGALTRLILLRC